MWCTKKKFRSAFFGPGSIQTNVVEHFFPRIFGGKIVMSVIKSVSIAFLRFEIIVSHANWLIQSIFFMGLPYCLVLSQYAKGAKKKRWNVEHLVLFASFRMQMQWRQRWNVLERVISINRPQNMLKSRRDTLFVLHWCYPKLMRENSNLEFFQTTICMQLWNCAPYRHFSVSPNLWASDESGMGLCSPFIALLHN